MFLVKQSAHTGNLMSRAWPRPGKAALVVAALAALVLAGGDAWARGGGSGGRGGGKSGHGGGKSGAHHSRGTHSHLRSGSTAFFGSYWAGPAYWLGQNIAFQPVEPVYYIERSEAELQTESAWFYCENDAAYYPYVTKCPTGWVKVAPPTQP
jgi:hypothetical protein